MYAWAIGEGLCESNPVIGTNKADEGAPRDRVLTDAELAAIWKAAPDSDYGRIVRLLMLTGQRRDEIGSVCAGRKSTSTQRRSRCPASGQRTAGRTLYRCQRMRWKS